MLRKFRETLKNKQRGAIMVFFAILVPLFLGAIGLAVDAGFLYMQKAKLQDVADATALAGAGHLKDENREEQVESAVIAFAGANGYKDKDEAASSNFLQLADPSSVTLEENADWKIAYAIDTNVTDKDGKQRDHVRVVILKRVPTFFIRMLFPEQNEVVVKAVAAAEYVEGEEPVVSYGGPKIVCNYLNYEVHDSETVKVSSGANFGIYAGASTIDYSKLPEVTSSTLYNTNWRNLDGVLPNGWNLIRTNEDMHWDLNNPKEKAEKEALDEAQAIIKKKTSQYKQAADDYVANKQDYIAGKGQKRYIGHDNSGQDNIISNIKEGDDNIDLYMDGTVVDVLVGQTHTSKNYSVILTNRQLKTVSHINNLIFGKHVAAWGGGETVAAYREYTIATEGITYGNIYTVGDGSKLFISGKKNLFDGLIFVQGQFYIGGEDNRYNRTNNTELFSVGGIYLGRSHDVEDTTVGGNSSKIWVGNERKEDSSWHMYWDGSDSSSGGSSSGSSGSGAAKAHVRLVI